MQNELNQDLEYINNLDINNDIDDKSSRDTLETFSNVNSLLHQLITSLI